MNAVFTINGNRAAFSNCDEALTISVLLALNKDLSSVSIKRVGSRVPYRPSRGTASAPVSGPDCKSDRGVSGAVILTT
jgi:hypothetical protein